MLVLRRRVGEAIVIGGVEVEVVEISRTRVKLGVRAPRTIPVTRREAIPVAAENRQAAAMLGSPGNMQEILQRLLKPAEARADM